MKHLLDNPIWNALISGNQNLAHGSEQAKFFDVSVAGFAGLKDNSENDLLNLRDQVAAQRVVVLFTPGEIKIPEGWLVKAKKDLVQMVFNEQELPGTEFSKEVVPLTDVHIPAMLDLTALTNPGPFFSRTIDFGNYEGIFEGSQLVAMTGQRMQPDPYTEVSAVCTHPDHLGKGYAGILIQRQIRNIVDNSRIPFLHTFSTNTRAIALYERLGFRLRKNMLVYILEKADL
ncbi:GNAT family N-acetyltransferase [Pedobacter sp. HMF7647]|uniref:GNAT family N-acetyltransferase n=1 Tax=Hufsiella arboris TaxID=2695275 RepID=A0A7K1Y6Y4_9SPHI|nr:GNAT family N-acetyltransferase [Hufsiella arboris]MXV50171.1 GNAT family N-acetyltransferase [Hufsiella arboris]